jgi:hypothetical protein
MFTQRPEFTLVSFLALSPGCYGNFVYGSDSGAAGETQPSSVAGTAFGEDITTVVTSTTVPPMEESVGPSTSPDTDPSTENTPDPGVTTDGAPQGIGCSNKSHPLARTVFVTNATYNGNLTPSLWDWRPTENGAMRGDVLCQCAATNAGIPGRFVAWLGDTNRSIRLSIEVAHSDVWSWHFVDTNGNCIAESWPDFAGGRLQTPIWRNEQKDILPAWQARFTWTGTTDDGDNTFMNCFNWTGSGLLGLGRGLVGDWRRSGPGWSGLSECLDGDCDMGRCDAFRHLYCIQTSTNPVPAGTLHPSCPPPSAS